MGSLLVPAVVFGDRGGTGGVSRCGFGAEPGGRAGAAGPVTRTAGQRCRGALKCSCSQHVSLVADRVAARRVCSVRSEGI